MSCSLAAQNRVVLNDDAYLVLENSAKIVVENGNSNALTTAGAGGNIATTTELDEIIWKVGTATGIYTIPFTTSSGVKIPLEINISTAGAGAGGLKLSTYLTSSANLPYPTGVADVNVAPDGTVDGSLKVIDRFWIIDPIGYTLKPDVTLKFAYDVNEIAAPNTITEGNLQAQRYNTNANDWESLLFGTQGMSSVSGVVIKPSNFFRVWTLVDNTTPLPIELLGFVAKLKDENVLLNWETATEINNDYFVLEKSADGINFIEFTQQPGAGNSHTIRNYSFIDKNPFNGVSYYRLKQVDFNGKFSYSEIESVTRKETLSIGLYPNPMHNYLTLSTNFDAEKEVSILIFSVTGKLIDQQKVIMIKGTTTFLINTTQLPLGTYFVKVISDNELIKVKKIIKH